MVAVGQMEPNHLFFVANPFYLLTVVGTRVGMCEVKSAAVQAEIVEHGLDAVLLHVGYERRALFKRAAHDVEHVGIVGGVCRNVGQSDESLVGNGFESGIILLPDGFATGLDGVDVLDLRPKEC